MYCPINERSVDSDRYLSPRFDTVVVSVIFVPIIDFFFFGLNILHWNCGSLIWSLQPSSFNDVEPSSDSDDDEDNNNTDSDDDEDNKTISIFDIYMLYEK